MMQLFVVTWLGIMLLCAHGTLAQVPPKQQVDIQVVLGAVIYRDSPNSPFLPAWSGEARSTAAAIVSNVSVHYGPRTPTLCSGGYLVGVRYTASGVIITPNSTIEAYALARNYDSEANAFASFMSTSLGIDRASILVEEDAAGTNENAEASNIIFTRLASFTFKKPHLTVGVVTNLYHMSRAMEDFKTYASAHDAVPIYAEDWVPLAHATAGGEDWITSVVQYYGRLSSFKVNLSELESIMVARRNGNFSRSVGELLGNMTFR